MRKAFLFAASLTFAFIGKAQTVSDVDGNVYNTIQIGTQTWMKENLKTTKYRNGDSIPNIPNPALWYDSNSGAYCNYNNDTSNAGTYGRLYNWHAVNDSRKIAPDGWHVPTYAEWNTLIDYLVVNGYGFMGTTSIAKALASKTGWQFNLGVGTIGEDPAKNDSSGFSALPGGYRYILDFKYIECDGFWWTATEKNTSNAWYFYLNYAYEDIFDYFMLKSSGFSIRCIMDSIPNDQITIIFNVDGGSTVPALTVTKDTKITQPPDPTKTGYNFGGWYKDPEFTNAWNFSTEVASESITLYAKWNVITYAPNKEATDFELYPNPAKDKLYIKTNSFDISGAIFDLQGNLAVEVFAGTTQIDISNLSKGIYMVKIIDSKNTVVFKLIKE